MNIITKLGAFRRYLLWICYDGSKFPEMAIGKSGYGVIDSLNRCLEACVDPAEASVSDIRLSPSSRTDTGVHALRTSVIAHIPNGESGGLDDSSFGKKDFLHRMNDKMNVIDPSFRLLDFHSVDPGFCARKHVSYRRYFYRLIVPKSIDVAIQKPNIPVITDRMFSWMLLPHFNPQKAANICQKFQGVHNMASFFKHTERERRADPYNNTMKFIQHCSLTRGEGYHITSTNHDYYNVTVISRSFVRQQIRRMIAVIVAHGYGMLSENDVEWLLQTPHPQNFFAFRGLTAAPPEGLFLADVAYDPKMFTNPDPRVRHAWDYSDDEWLEFELKQ